MEKEGLIGSRSSLPMLPRLGLERHSITEWKALTESKENEAAAGFALAECVRFQGSRAREGVRETTLQLQNDSSQALLTRSQASYALASQLYRLIWELREETGRLEEIRVRVENALSSTSDALLHVVNECLRLRCTRIGIDLTLDSVEIELQRERGLILETRTALEEYLGQVLEQIGTLRSAKEALEKDWSDKVVAFRIDEAAYRLGPGWKNATVTKYPGVARFQEGMIELPQWEERFKDNMTRAEEQLHSGRGLRDKSTPFLSSLATSLRRQSDVVDSALRGRITETEAQKGRLRHQLKLVLEEIVRAENGIHSMRTALRVDPLEAGLRLAQTRLFNRTFRPSGEMTKDGAQFKLVKEVGELNICRDSLLAQVSGGEDALQRLRGIRIDLEKEIAVKDNSLVIDGERCLQIRGYYPSLQDLMGK